MIHDIVDYDVNTDDKVAEVGRLLLCDTYLSKSNPYGLEALLLSYNYVFNVMNFRKITGIIAAVNTTMVKLQLFLGMKQEGYLEKHTLINGNFEDLHILSIFKNEFNNTYTKKTYTINSRAGLQTSLCINRMYNKTPITASMF